MITRILHKGIRILEVRPEHIIGASGYKLYKINNGDRLYFSTLQRGIFSFLSKYRLISRFFRAEIYSYKTLKNRNGICIAKKGIYLENKIKGRFDKVYHIARGSRPLAICENNNGDLFFGEYFDNKKRLSVHIYASFDSGKSWKVVYTFPSNTIRHIHTIKMDPFTGFLWIATGDEENECIIGYSKDNFQTLEIVAKGGQEYRTCNFLFLKDKIVYGTDSPKVVNYIKAINRKDFFIQSLQRVQGSVINAEQIDKRCFISTTVEPSKINTDKNSYLWISDNGESWIQIDSFKKDVYNGTLFQFGNIRFPHYTTNDPDSLYFSGHALKKIDGHSIEIININDYFNISTE